MTGLMASEARAQTLTLTVLSGTTTIYSTTGLMTKVVTDVGALNVALTVS
jgi:hypothetical protein